MASGARDWRPTRPPLPASSLLLVDGARPCDPVDGWLAHAVYWDESGGIHITNMWVSIEHMQNAFATRLGPVMRSIGIPPPHGEVHETFNLSVF